MSIHPISAAAIPGAKDSTTTSNPTNTSAADFQQTFMQLLATELQSQDPTQTVDPTTMVTQMVQINQLSDVAGIYSILQGAQTPASTTSAAAGPVAAGSSHSAQSIPGGN